MGLVKSDLKNINDLIEGYDSEVPMAIYGIAMTGKTLLMMQEAFYLMSQLKKNALFISTEVGVKRYIEKMEPIFRKRFNVPDSLKLILIEIPPQESHLVKVLEAFGKKVNMTMSEKGKVDVSFLGSESSKVETTIDKNNVGILIIDSLTKPFKSEEFAGVLKNLPSRATGVNIWLNAIHALTLKHKLFCFVSHHASQDPTNPYAVVSMTGGSDIKYDFKIQIYLDQSKSLQYSNMRWIYLMRFFNVKEGSKKTRLWVDDQGYQDVTDAFMDTIKTQKAAEKKERELKKEGKLPDATKSTEGS